MELLTPDEIVRLTPTEPLALITGNAAQVRLSGMPTLERAAYLRRAK